MPALPHQSIVSIASLQDLAAFASQLADWIQPGDLITLDGNLGAGKTTLVQHLTKALGLSETISSPTFVLMNEYHSGPFPVIHADLYRLGPERADSMADELIAMADEGRSVILVEWACYSAQLEPVVTTAISIAYGEGDAGETRTITLQANRALPEALAGQPHD